MNRKPLAERLRTLAPKAQQRSIPLLDMTIIGFMEMLRTQVPNSRKAVYYLFRFSEIGVDAHATLADAALSAAELAESEIADRYLYRLLVLPFLKIMEGRETNG